jgi:excisionase family DNA binding protein
MRPLFNRRDAGSAGTLSASLSGRARCTERTMDDRRYVTAETAAKMLEMSRAALYMQIHRGKIEFIRHGRMIRFDVRKLDQMMARKTEKVA